MKISLTNSRDESSGDGGSHYKQNGDGDNQGGSNSYSESNGT